MFICRQFIFRAIINVNERNLYNLFMYLFNAELFTELLSFFCVSRKTRGFLQCCVTNPKFVL